MKQTRYVLGYTVGRISIWLYYVLYWNVATFAQKMNDAAYWDAWKDAAAAQKRRNNKGAQICAPTTEN